MDETIGVVLFEHGRELDLARNLDAIGCPSLPVTFDETNADGRSMTRLRVPFSENRIMQVLVSIFALQLLAVTSSGEAGLTDVKFRYRQSGKII